MESKKELLKLNWPLIEQQMKRKKITQIKLAELLGISRNAISSWKSNLYSPTNDRIDKLCSILEIDNSSIFLTTALMKQKSHSYQSELLSTMLALSKLEDLLSVDESNDHFKNDEKEEVKIKSENLRRLLLAIYNREER